MCSDSSSWGVERGRRLGSHRSGLITVIAIAVIAIVDITIITFDITIVNGIVARTALRREDSGSLFILIVKFNDNDSIT